jgi:cytochrome c5
MSIFARILIMALVAAFGLTGCESPARATDHASPTALPAAAPPTSASAVSSPEFSAGRQLYQAKCARCHKFYDPAAYSDADWHMWMTKMAKKSKLNPEQQQILSRYLDTFRAGK